MEFLKENHTKINTNDPFDNTPSELSDEPIKHLNGFKLMSLKWLEKKKNNCSKMLAMVYRKENKVTETKWSLWENWPSIYDQMTLSSCTANAYCSVYKYISPDKSFDPSRLYVYYKERLVEEGSTGWSMTDNGANVEDGIAYVSSHGVCAEENWPYDVEKVNVAPPMSADSNAVYHKLGKLFTIRVDSNLKNTIKYCLVQNIPVLLAFAVYQSFENVGKDGIVSIPSPKNFNDYNDPIDPFMGGHEVVIIGFDDETQMVECVNSWKDTWGDHGKFYMHYKTLCNSNYTYQLCCVVN